MRILTTARATTPLLHPPQVPSDSPVEACLQVPEHEGPALQNSSLLLPSSVLFPRHPSRTAAREFPPVLCFSAHLSPTQSFPSSLPASPGRVQTPLLCASAASDSNDRSEASPPSSPPLQEPGGCARASSSHLWPQRPVGTEKVTSKYCVNSMLSVALNKRFEVTVNLPFVS